MFESVSMQQSLFMKHYELTRTHYRRGADEEHYTLAHDFYSDADDKERVHNELEEHMPKIKEEEQDIRHA